MIRVAKRPEPTNFDKNVRQPGKKYLSSVKVPKFEKANFWKFAASDLHEAYDKVCSYSCFYLTNWGGCSIDHFLPKSRYPAQAYEWSNYRLANQRINSYKGNSEEVLDPFVIQDGWFVLDFPSCLVKPGEGLDAKTLQKVTKTIDILRLNRDDNFVQERCDLMTSFADGEVTLAFMQKRCPFLAKEITRQNLQQKIQELFKRRASSGT